MALETLAFNDVLNNDTAHFFKSGNIRRSSENKKFSEVKFTNHILTLIESCHVDFVKLFLARSITKR